MMAQVRKHLSESPAVPCFHPETFNDFHQKWSRGGDAALSGYFEPVGGLAVCPREPVLQSHTGKVWIFDADDTLWEDNIVYEKLASQLIDCACRSIPGSDPKVLRKIIDDAEHELIPKMGFGPVGFAESMKLAFSRMCALTRDTIEVPSDFFERLVPILSEVPDSISISTHATLRGLRAAGDALILFTMGPHSVQHRKIYNSGLAPLFHVVAVTHKKESAAYGELIRRTGYGGREIAVVGNSLKSDVAPAVELGWRAYHYRNPNTWHSGTNAAIPAEKFTAIDSLTELLSIP
jgi:putative hydrolase of the HAD superfamily